MDFGGEESPSKRRCYERSSTPIRELYPYKLPSLLSEEEETEVRENGLDIVEEPIAPAQVQREEDTLRPDDINVDGHDPENYGLSNEAMESFISEVEEECVGLPNELWQLIFQRVPLLDLVTSGRRVCQRWNQIIADEKFLHWKKMYFQLKHCDPATISTVTTILRPLSFTTSAINNQTLPSWQPCQFTPKVHTGALSKAVCRIVP